MKSEKLQELAQIAWRVLSGLPIEVLDDDTEQLIENPMWELVNPRLEGEYKGSRMIGSGNVVTALNLIQQKLIADNPNYESSMYAFNQVLVYLEQEKMIRKKPEKQRQTFKIVK